jgi:hypothetical protein
MKRRSISKSFLFLEKLQLREQTGDNGKNVLQYIIITLEQR